MANTAGQSYGGFWVRVLAYLVDSVIFFTLLVAIAAGAAFLGESGALVITAATLVGPLLYWGLMQASARQATFGKSLLGMKVADSDGQRLWLRRHPRPPRSGRPRRPRRRLRLPAEIRRRSSEPSSRDSRNPVRRAPDRRCSSSTKTSSSGATFRSRPTCRRSASSKAGRSA